MRRLIVTASALARTVSAVAERVARADNDMAARIAAADSYLVGRPGVVGYVLRDRTTGAVYRGRDHHARRAGAAGGPRRRLTDELGGGVMSLSICENS
jgi:hypothetical protein